MARTKSRPLSVNVEWFQEQMKLAGITSQRELGSAMGLDASQVSQFFLGRRRKQTNGRDERVFRNPTIWEVADMARVLKCSTDQVIRNLGVPVPSHGIPVAGKITDECQVYISPPRGEVVESHAPPGAQALTMMSEGSALESYNGASFIWLPAVGPNLVAEDVFGSLCVVEVDDELTPFLGFPRKHGRGKFVIELFDGSEFDASTIHRASRVLSIHFP